MIIDFHTHVFPDKIAKSTIDALAKNSNGTPYTDGTVYGLIDSMKKGGIDLSITFPVLTKPTQFEKVTQFVIDINERFSNSSPKILSFAGIHPDCDDIPSKLKLLKDNGIKGVKIHPDYQLTNFNDDKYIQIIKSAKDNELIVITHSGIDNGYLNQPVRCTPDMVLDVYKRVKYNKLVLAHYGAHKMWSETFDKLCGLDLYFDTAFTMHQIEEDVFKKILNKHDADKILFASDSPWGDVRKDADRILSFNLSKEVKDKIFYKNALKLLDLEKNK